MHGKVICGLPPHHLYLAFLPMLSLPNSPPAAFPPLVPPHRLQRVMLPSLCPCVLIVQYQPMSENMPCLIFCSCISLLRMMVSRFVHVPTKDTNSSFFYGSIVFHGIYVPHFLYPFVSGHLCCFHIFAIVNNATVNMIVQISFKHMDLGWVQ